MASFGGPLSRDSTGTIRRREITLSPREKQMYAQLWSAADKEQNGFITGADAVPFFAKSGLPTQVLEQIWVLADTDNKGVLGQQGFSIAVKLIAHAQNGKTPSATLINADAPLPHFDGLTPSKTGDSPAAASPITAQNTGPEPALTSEDKNKYGSMFLSCGPVNGLLDGDKARDLFLKSKLPFDILGQIWGLADTKQRGSLDVTDFTIAMYYIQHMMNGSIKTLPSTLPASILRACSASSGAGSGLISSPVLGAQTLTRQVTGNNLSIHSPAITRQMTGSLGKASSPLAQQATGAGNALFGGGSVSADIPWEVTPEDKAKFDVFFDRLDPNGTGFVGGEEASKFFLNSRLPGSVLAQIWDLSDITGSGSLSKDEFAVAMLLINRKNATGSPVPKTLPLSLIPPSLRNRVTSSLSFTSQEPVRSMTLPGASSQGLRRQSFDLLGDGPTLSTSFNSTSMTQADKDLIGADDLTSKITSETGELASLQNQINNLGKVTGDLQAKRTQLEQSLSSLSSQKQDISIRLNQIKTLHESETKSIKELESALATIQPQLLKLREELTVSERELTVARANKDDFLLSLARDQEENNLIKTRLRQNHDEIAKLREELEAKKKDTGRQKGLLEIARRQLAASDGDKNKLLNEIALESEKGAQHAKDIQAVSFGSPSQASPVPSAPGIVAPPPPAPRGSRKEPPPPPASRGSGFTSRVIAEEEEAFGIPEALRSPTGSLHSTHSLKSGANAANANVNVSHQSAGSSPFETISKQGTGPSPFESISRQGTGSSPFESISRQATGSSPFDAVAPQLTGTSINAPSISSLGDNGSNFLQAPAGAKAHDEIWSPNTHAAQAKFAGQPEVTMSPDPETPMPTQESVLAFAAAQTLPTSPPVSQDPFGTMGFPAIDTPPVTKVDFDAAFQGFSIGKPSADFTSDSVRSAEAFAEAFPDIDSVGAGNASTSKRVSAFGFEDDFSSSAPFGQAPDRTKEDDEFPPIVEVPHAEEEDSSDDDDDNEAFVQAKSSVTSPQPSDAVASTETKSNVALSAPVLSKADSGSPFESSATSAAPVSTASIAAKKLTAADFSEFESFGASTDDFDSAFKGVELAAPKITSGAGSSGNIAGFDDGFDFSASFDDAFGPSSGFGTGGSIKAGASSNAAPSDAFGTVNLDEAFGSFSTPAGNAAEGPSAGAGAGAGAGANAFGGGFGDFEAEFSKLPATTKSSRPVPDAPKSTTAVKSAVPSGAIDASATLSPMPPQVTPAGVDELTNMGFTRQQAMDALLRYDTVERAANFLLEGE